MSWPSNPLIFIPSSLAATSLASVDFASMIACFSIESSFTTLGYQKPIPNLSRNSRCRPVPDLQHVTRDAFRIGHCLGVGMRYPEHPPQAGGTRFLAGGC